MLRNRKITVIVISVLIAVFAFGVWNSFAQDTTTPTAPCDFGQMYGMMGGRNVQGRGMGPGMMGGNYSNYQNYSEDCLQNGFYGMGMMGGMMGQYGAMGQMMGFNSQTIGRFGPGAGMMGAWTPSSELAPSGDSLTFDEATAIAKAYIAQWDTETALELGEVMQFDNHFYATAREVESGRGAFEFLIDPTTGIVYGEPGPNMMWNLRYGMSMGRGFGIYETAPVDSEMTVSVEQAQTYAQTVLDEALPGTSVDTEADTFYGYYTFHILRDGEIVGMLGVNAYTGQVWLHHWHGEFIAMSGHIE